MSQEQTDPWIGSRIDDRYVIEERIARGGMSTVYRAQDHRLGREVALKVLFPHMAEDRKVVDRFEQEARNSALIAHPNVVQVLDQGQSRETAYLVMEYVPGATLRTLLKHGAMTPRLALTYMDSILQGLAAAHRAGLVHRDIKPENVLVSHDGRIKLADLGLARAATHHSGTSTLMGTVAYISPELLSGESADERSDIYAIGILLYEMLTGVQPFTGDSPVRVAYQHVNSTVPVPSAQVSGLAAELDDLVSIATRPEVALRPKNADELLKMLREARGLLSDAELDFDGALTTAATRAIPAVGASGRDSAQSSTSPGQRSTTMLPGDSSEAFLDTEAHPDDPQTRVAEPWDEDIEAALGNARTTHLQAEHRDAAYERPSSLAEEDRQLVTQVPISGLHPRPPRLSVADPVTGIQPAVGARRPVERVRTEKRERQRPTVELERANATRVWLMIAAIMIGGALLVLLAGWIGTSDALIPSLGG
ncbi:protein kinase domain-containing protein [Nesterenkonia sandarakina]|uniref:non-specific serine/threonine protein kinase n=1 Tax=Nesterenkonia sandarakina TaxID=272918 RepID=A0A2T0YHV6_9MICC|nr:protein kinase [Nesterenkonia sandarakina]PRZ14581.1 serine/threonine-protein kinase [Nesterenkonia sandarakina]